VDPLKGLKTTVNTRGQSSACYQDEFVISKRMMQNNETVRMYTV